MTAAAVLEQFGTRMRDSVEGRDLQARELGRLRAWCERNGVPFSSGVDCHGGNNVLEVEVGEPVGSGV